MGTGGAGALSRSRSRPSSRPYDGGGGGGGAPWLCRARPGGVGGGPCGTGGGLGDADGGGAIVLLVRGGADRVSADIVILGSPGGAGRGRDGASDGTGGRGALARDNDGGGVGKPLLAPSESAAR